MMPLVWTRETRLDEQRTRRVVCSTIGASEDFESEGLRRVFINAAYWCLELEHLIPDASAVDYITKYEPSPFGHGKYRRDVRPDDHALTR